MKQWLNNQWQQLLNLHPKLKRMSKQQNKKRKLEHSSQFTDPEDIRKSFRAQNPDVVVKGRVAQVSSLSISKHFYQP